MSPAAATGRRGSWLASHKPEAALGAGGIVVAIALYVRSKQNAAGGSSSAIPATANTTGTDVYNGLENQVLGLQGAVLALATGQTGTPPAAAKGGAKPKDTDTGSNKLVAHPIMSPEPLPSLPPVPAAPPPGPSQGTVDIGGTNYDVLGFLAGGGSYTGENVGGGAPVFFSPPGGSLETNLTPQGVSGLPTGTEVLTPVAYGAQIRPGVVSEHLGA